jgi:hypothetical protein
MRLLGALTTITLVCCSIAACNSEGRTRGPSTLVTAVHAAPAYGEIAFLREERIAGALTYRDAGTFSYEVGQYDFNLEVTPLGQSTPDRKYSFSEILLEGTHHFFVVTQDGANLNPILFTTPDFSTTATNAEVILVHAAPALAGTDVYLTSPGADLSAANPIASLSFRQNSNPQTAAAGDYQLSITEAGNPLNVLFSSPTQTLAAGFSNLFVITDGAGEGLATISVVRASDTNAVLSDVNTPSSMRVVNAASDTLPRDIAIDDDFANLLFPAAPYASPTAFSTITPGARKLTVTPAGNPGVIEVELTSSIAGGRFYTTLVATSGSALTAQTFVEDRRPINGQSGVRILNGATQLLDFFILEVGTPIAGFQSVQLSPGTVSQPFSLPPGDRELTIMITDTQTIAYGPSTFTLEDGGTHSVLAIDGATAETIDTVLFDDFN